MGCGGPKLLTDMHCGNGLFCSDEQRHFPGIIAWDTCVVISQGICQCLLHLLGPLIQLCLKFRKVSIHDNDSNGFASKEIKNFVQSRDRVLVLFWCNNARKLHSVVSVEVRS